MTRKILVLEFGFHGKSVCMQPVHKRLIETQTNIGNLRCMNVSVNKAGNEKFISAQFLLNEFGLAGMTPCRILWSFANFDDLPHTSKHWFWLKHKNDNGSKVKTHFSSFNSDETIKNYFKLIEGNRMTEVSEKYTAIHVVNEFLETEKNNHLRVFKKRVLHSRS